jgi:hypothetical protein
MTRRVVYPVNARARETAHRYVDEATPDDMVIVQQRTRTLEQNAKFHAICTDLAKSRLVWQGKRRTAAQWKVLLVSGHGVATKEGSEMVPGIEGEFVNLRESTAQMTRSRGASLITYALAFCDANGVELSEPVLAEPA